MDILRYRSLKTDTAIVTDTTFPPPARKPYDIVDVPKGRKRKIHSWFDTDHGASARQWCQLAQINTHPQRRKRTHSPAARNYANRLQRQLFFHSLKTLCPQASFQPHRNTSTSFKRRLRRLHNAMLQPTDYMLSIGHRSIFQRTIPTSPPKRIPSQIQIIQELLQQPKALKAGASKPKTRRIYILANEESKGDVPYVKLLPT